LGTTGKRLWEDLDCVTGIDHAVSTTADAEANIAFYRDTLGLELVRNSPTGCRQHGHLSYRESGTDGNSFLHFIVNPEATKGETGAGPVKRLWLQVATAGGYEDSYEYWGDRLDAAGVHFDSYGDNPQHWFKDPDGLGLKIDISYGDSDPDPVEFEPGNPVPDKYRLTGISGARIETPDRSASAFFMRHVFGCAVHDQRDLEWRKLIFNQCGRAFVGWHNPTDRPVGEAGSVHHVAFGCPPGGLESFHSRMTRAGVAAGEISDHPEIGARCFAVEEPGGTLLEVSAIT
jgi:glyoxalase family protein